jgi:NADH dehydrogenase
MSEDTTTAPHVVILGGGFAGLHAAKELAGERVRVTLVDRRNHHLFQPLLYQVATAALNPSDIAIPIRRVLRNAANVTVLLGEAKSVEPAKKRVVLDDGSALEYDYLVVATGATHSYFGNDAWAAHAPGLKSLEDALEIRRRVLLAFEAAEREPGVAARHAWLTFVVVGAGPTGVELAGAFAEIARRVLRRDFRRIDPGDARVFLVEAGPRILSMLDPSLSDDARRELVRMGVDVVTGERVLAIDGEGVQVGTRRIAARTVIWAAGVAASPLAKSLGVPLDRAGRVSVADDLRAPGLADVWVTGDLAAFVQNGKPIGGLAPIAIQQGTHAARSILRAVDGLSTRPFTYVDRGTMVTIGKASAVADVRGWRFGGTFAWLAWLFVHVFFLIGFRNRVVVIAQWAYVYLRNERGARLITGERRP